MSALNPQAEKSITYILLGASNLLYSKSVVQVVGGGELLLGESLDELDTLIRVVDALDLVTDTRDYNTY
jgi:hypothetical protein